MLYRVRGFDAAAQRLRYEVNPRFDSLMLSPEQTGALKAAQVQYRRNVDAIWTELARYLATLPDRYDAVEALKRQEDATDRAWEASRQEGATIKALLSPLQQRMLPSLVDTVINSREKIRIRYIVR